MTYKYVVKPYVYGGKVDKVLLAVNMMMAVIYMGWWVQPGHMGNPLLFGLLVAGEIYHVLMAIAFWFTLWPGKPRRPLPPSLTKNFQPSVDVMITVCGEPVEVVRETVKACRDMDYPNHKVFVLNDGYVAKKDNWQDIEDMCSEEGVFCITRKIPGGAKAGNVNNSVRLTRSELITLFDADMVPKADYLTKMVPYFTDPKIGFVQSPQYYKDRYESMVTGASWEQQEFFFGPIMRGKDKSNSVFICGTNFVIKRQALESAGGMCEDNIAEDFLTSLKVHQNGWRSLYHDEVLVEGMAPQDMLSYFKQQLRWARGSLEVVFSQNPFLKRGLSLAQRIQYLSSALYYFNGPIVLLDMSLPLLFLFTGISPVAGSSTSFAIFFVPFMFLNLLTLYTASQGKLTFRAISFSYSSFYLQLMALVSIILKQKMGFSVTPKQAQTGNFINLAYPHLLYIGLSVVGIYVAISREGLSSAVFANLAWILFNCMMFMPFIKACLPVSWFDPRHSLSVRKEPV